MTSKLAKKESRPDVILSEHETQFKNIFEFFCNMGKRNPAYIPIKRRVLGHYMGLVHAIKEGRLRNIE